MAKLPAIQFYPGDWRKDVGVQSLSYHDRGVWFEMLMLMHESEVRGKLMLGGKAMTDDVIASVLRIRADVLSATIRMLIERGVTEREKRTGALINRRMVRDEELRAENRGKLQGWRKAKKLKENGNYIETQMKPLSSSSTSSSITKTNTTTPLTRRGFRLPADFCVTEEHRRFAEEKNYISPDQIIDEFRDYWIAVPGSRGVKLDWDATFRNRMREKTRPNGGNNGTIQQARRETQNERVLREAIERNSEPVDDAGANLGRHPPIQ